MDCLDAGRLFELFNASSPAPMRDDVERHLDGCERCRQMVAAYARVADEDDTAAEISPYAPTLRSDRPAAGPRAATGDLIAQRYLLDRVVGEGGMGVVWAARDLRSNREVALKILKIESAELSARALREAEIAGVVGHPNVVPVHEIVSRPGAPPILVMALLVGESLDRALARRRTLPLAETLAVLLPLTSAVRAAHARGVLHRDLKPQNVFLARAGDEPPIVMLMDFGLAKILGQEVETLTRTGAIVGTPHYMAPEQLYGERDIDRRADVWAIGAIACECLTGARPLEGASYAQLVRSAARRKIEPLAARLPEGAPRALGRIVDRMLAHDREDRPELSEVHAELFALMHGG